MELYKIKSKLQALIWSERDKKITKLDRDMEPMKFKTNIKCSGCVAKVTPSLNETAGQGKWDVDLSSPEKVLSITTAIPEDKVKEALEKAGYKAEKL